METEIDLKKIESKAYRSYLEDGGWDLFLGIMMLGMGLRIFTDNIWFTLWLVVAVPVMLGIKYTVTNPRLGKVKFSTAREMKMTMLTILIGTSVVLTTIVLMLAVAGFDLPVYIIGVSFVALVVIVFAAIAYYMDYLRLFLYGLVLAGCMAISEVYGDEPASIAFMVCGCIIIGVGLVTFAQFLQRYPSVDVEALNNGA